MSPTKRRRMLNGAVIGGISGLILSAVFYFAVAPNPSYFMFTVFGLLIGIGQAYVSRD